VVVGGAVLVLTAGAAAFLITRGGDDPAVAIGASGTTVPTASVTTAPPTVPETAPPTTTTTEPDPGSLPQTPDKPSATSPKLAADVDALWQAIVADDPIKAMRFFFPLGAYLQVKAISNPESDWRTRLVAAYVEDIHALHAKLGALASTAQLAGLDVPESQAVWVQPGAEYNKGSYWRVYGASLRYTADGQSASFPIASMISWRGEWYVVHLNSIR
jgi:hypothetical protein